MVNDSLKSPVFYTKVGIKKRPNDKVCSKSDFVNGLNSIFNAVFLTTGICKEIYIRYNDERKQGIYEND
ncbi:hypothetical protein A9CBEGH2_12030 [Amedibacterium intestinale]|nr:hypothetical protein A9CBEGH2_12030 [Amedibacterium intestinale]